MDGIINLFKPSGMTSQSAVTRVKRLLGAEKAGHCGTLDPMATGVLPVMVGCAVKASEYLADHDKEYLAGITLGITTDTGDITGNVLSEYSGELPGFGAFAAAAARFAGKQEQVPPMYSALKKDGKKLVDLARKGISVERAPRKIEIYSIEPGQDDGGFTIRVACSRGTYIRTLCEDIGAVLGCGGCMRSLERTGVGMFRADESVTLEDIEKGDYRIIPVEEVFGFPALRLPDFFDRLFSNGQEIYLKKIGLNASPGDRFRIYGNNGFYATAQVLEFPDGPALKPEKYYISAPMRHKTT